MGSVTRFSLVFTAVLTTASLLLSACGSKPAQVPQQGQGSPAAPPAAGGPSGTFVFANTQDAKILNPILSGDLYSSYIDGLVYDSLISVDDKSNLKPGLAKTWDIATDGLSVTFHLFENVKWHDGQPFTANDVRFTFGTILHPGYTGPRRSNIDQIKGVPEMDAELKKLDKKAADYDQKAEALWENFMKTGGIQVIDNNTIKISLARVFAPFMLGGGGLGIIPEHLFKDALGKKMPDSQWNQKPVGTGPYKFVEWKKGEQITLEANPDYRIGMFGHPARIKTFVFKVVPDSNAGMAALQNGEVDYAGIDADNWDRFRAMSNLKTFEWLAYGYQFIGYNQDKEIFKDKRVRQALTMAIDREAIVRDLRKGHGEVANTHGSPVRWDYNPNVKKWPYDPNMARQYLEEAGWKAGPGGIRVKDGKPLAFTFTYSSGNSFLEQMAPFVQQAWKAVGADVKLEALKFEAITDKLAKDEQEAFTIGWNLGNEPDSYSIFACDGGFKYIIHYCNPDVDRLENAGRGTMDLGQRKQIYGELAQVLAEDQPYTWISYNTSMAGFSTRVHGESPNAPGGIFWNFTEWTVDGQ